MASGDPRSDHQIKRAFSRCGTVVSPARKRSSLLPA